MYRINSQKADRKWVQTLLAWICLFSTISGCGGSGGGDSASTQTTGTALTQNQSATSEDWAQAQIRQLQASGMLIPSVQASYDGDSTVHLAYFTDSQNTASEFTVNHSLFDLQGLRITGTTEVIDVDNSRTLSLVLGVDDSPVVAYQGGQVRECGSEQQSDVMMNVGAGNSWTEATAGIGFVERNPVFQDGLAGRNLAAVADSQGNMHVVYQFFYEGCDAMNFNYPDLLYVRKQVSNPQADAQEETVEGNIYNANGTASAQNTLGYHVKIILDADEDPAVFYDADLSPNNSDPDRKGLRVARRKGGVWTHEWVEIGIEVGAISASMDPNGNLAVAYYVESPYTDSLGTHEKLLKYAVQTLSGWNTMIVDETVQCGRHCSLSFTTEGNPAVAYYAEQNHSGSTTLQDLKYAEYSGSAWETETVSAQGDIGYFNRLWFDNTGAAYICSYSESLNTIFLFYR